MRTFMVPALATIIAMSSGAALAWSDVVGMITKVDANAHEVTLDNGKTYVAQKDVQLKDLKVGDKVTVSTEVENGRDVANKVDKTS